MKQKLKLNMNIKNITNKGNPKVSLFSLKYHAVKITKDITLGFINWKKSLIEEILLSKTSPSFCKIVVNSIPLNLIIVFLEDH